MSNVYFMGDLHLGHRNIINLRPKFSTIEEHDDYMIDMLCSTMTKRDSLYLLGDVAFKKSGLYRLEKVPGRKYLVRGNHDDFDTGLYLTIFEQIYGILKYKDFWLTHAPIHPAELRGRRNIHGHVHVKTITRLVQQDSGHYWTQVDPRYINTCPEVTGYVPINLADIPDESSA